MNDQWHALVRTDTLLGPRHALGGVRAQLALIEPLRTLRIMHYAGWLARRWDDPAFPRSFPWFEEPKYWEQHVLNLREQIAAMQDDTLLG